MKKPIRIAAALCCLTGVLVTAGPRNVRATSASAFPSPGPGIITTIGGFPTSAAASALFMNGPITISGSSILINRLYDNGYWSVDPSAKTAIRLAGDGSASYGGDGGPALAAGFDSTAPVAVDGLGRIYIADTYNSRIRRVDLSGNVETVAGIGIPGYAGDGGPATSASLYLPTAVAALPDGTFYFLDQYRIRRVATNGLISTYAGTGTGGSSSGDGGSATNATLGDTYGSPLVADSAGNVYFIADSGTRIRKVATNGNISTVVGDGTAGSGVDGGSALTQISASALAVSPSGTIYVGQSDRVRQVSGGVITALATTPTGSSSLAAAAGGIVYLTDGSGYIYKVQSGSASVLAGTVNAASGDGQQARNVEFGTEKSIILLSDGSLILSEIGNGRVRKISTDGIVSTLAGGGLSHPDDGVVATDAAICPRGLARDALDTIYFVDSCTSTVFAIGGSGPPTEGCW